MRRSRESSSAGHYSSQSGQRVIQVGPSHRQRLSLAQVESHITTRYTHLGPEAARLRTLPQEQAVPFKVRAHKQDINTCRTMSSLTPVTLLMLSQDKALGIWGLTGRQVLLSY